jgi:tetratricopeptide (TPR) repeat protein
LAKKLVGLRRLPHYAAAYYNRGRAYFRENDHAQAIEDYDRALELDPSYVNACFNRGDAYQSIGRKEKAITSRDA